LGKDINLIKAKLIANLPSPSGSSNTAWLNVKKEEHAGLHTDFFDFIQ